MKHSNGFAQDSLALTRKGNGRHSTDLQRQRIVQPRSARALDGPAMQRHWIDLMSIATAMLSRARFSQATAKSGFDKHSTAKAKHVMAKR